MDNVWIKEILSGLKYCFREWTVWKVGGNAILNEEVKGIVSRLIACEE